MVAALRRELGDDVSWPDPRGGFFLWAKLPPPIDAERLLVRAVGHGVVYVAGEAFFVDGAGHDFMRLSFSAPTHAKIREGVMRLAAAVRRGDELLTAPGPPPTGTIVPQSPPGAPAQWRGEREAPAPSTAVSTRRRCCR